MRDQTAQVFALFVPGQKLQAGCAASYQGSLQGVDVADRFPLRPNERTPANRFSPSVSSLNLQRPPKIKKGT